MKRILLFLMPLLLVGCKTDREIVKGEYIKNDLLYDYKQTVLSSLADSLHSHTTVHITIFDTHITDSLGHNPILADIDIVNDTEQVSNEEQTQVTDEHTESKTEEKREYEQPSTESKTSKILKLASLIIFELIVAYLLFKYGKVLYKVLKVK